MAQIVRIHTGGRPAIRDEHGNKRCPHCGVWQPADAAHFSVLIQWADGGQQLKSWCRACMRGYMQQKRKAVSA